MNIIQMLNQSRLRFGDKPAITHEEHRHSYRDIDEKSDTLAGSLQSYGVTKRDRIAILLNNSPEFMIVYFGIIKLGAIAVLLDPKYKQDELLSLISDCRPKIIIGETSNLNALLPIWEKLGYVEFFIDAGHSSDNPHYIKLSELLASNNRDFKPVTINDADTAHIAYTSGPSFAPMGVITPHGNLAEEIRISAESFCQTENDVVVQFALPLHHVIGLAVIMLTALYCGSEVILLNGISTDSLMATIELHHVSMFIGVPFIHAMLLRKVREEGIRHNLSSLRFAGSAGDMLPYAIVEQYKQLLNLRLINFYGLTETMGHVTCEALDECSIPNCAGKALPGWEIKITDEPGQALAPGQQGEIAIRGPFMSGYYGKKEATALTIRHGWLHTGDRGYLDNSSNLYITGLQKDMRICKGQNIFPSDIEHVLSEHPSVAQAAAVGVPEVMRGEVIGAAIVIHKDANIDETTLQKFCLERMANYKTPKHFAFMESLPVKENGAIDKQRIRKLFIHRTQNPGHSC
jgi:long-chain acyl-CoA synthetase